MKMFNVIFDFIAHTPPSFKLFFASPNIIAGLDI